MPKFPYAVWTGDFPELHDADLLPGQLITPEQAVRVQDTPTCIRDQFRETACYLCPACGARLFAAAGRYTWTARHFRHGHFSSCAGVHESHVEAVRLEEQYRGFTLASWTGLLPRASEHEGLEPGDLIDAADGLSRADIRHIHGEEGPVYRCPSCKEPVHKASSRQAFGGLRPHWRHASDGTCAPTATESVKHAELKNEIASAINRREGVYAAVEVCIGEARPDVVAHFPDGQAIAIEVVVSHRPEFSVVQALAPSLIVIRATEIEGGADVYRRVAEAAAVAVISLHMHLANLERGNIRVEDLQWAPWARGRRLAHRGNAYVPAFLDRWEASEFQSVIRDRTVGRLAEYQERDVKIGEKPIMGLREVEIGRRPRYKTVREVVTWQPKKVMKRVMIGASKETLRGSLKAVTVPVYREKLVDGPLLEPVYGHVEVEDGDEAVYALREVQIGSEPILESRQILASAREIVIQEGFSVYSFDEEPLIELPHDADDVLHLDAVKFLNHAAKVRVQLGLALMINQNRRLASIIEDLLGENGGAR